MIEMLLRRKYVMAFNAKCNEYILIMRDLFMLYDYDGLCYLIILKRAFKISDSKECVHFKLF